MYVILALVSIIVVSFGAPLADIPQCPVDQCGVALTDTGFYGLRHRAMRLRNDVDEANEVEISITYTNDDATTIAIGLTSASDSTTNDAGIAIEIPLSVGAASETNVISSKNDNLENLFSSGAKIPFGNALGTDNYENTNVAGETSIVITIRVEYSCINALAGNCGSTGKTTIELRSTYGPRQVIFVENAGVLGAPGDSLYLYMGSIGGSLTIDGIIELCEEADNFGDGLYCVKNSENAPKPLECYVAIHAPGYNPLLPHWAQNAKQWLWDDARAACIAGDIISGTVDLASLHTVEENNAAVAAMRYSGCQSAFFGMQGIQGYNDYDWVDGTSCPSSDCADHRLWRGRNDPNAYTAAEASVGYMEVLSGDGFPACGYFFWADECRPVGKHPCAICVKYVTDAPTATPTTSPTDSPTKVPSKTPTTSPSESPTTTPSTTPTKAPTSTPTTSPSKSPSTSPTTSPTTTPSVSPTKAPTTTPSTTPSVSPTKAPTSTPSTTPTTTPSTSPTTTPTTTPTVTPTTTPTTSPSSTPSTTPTETPTSTPTKSPTTTPSTTPTSTPTTTPTTSPSKSPSTTPTTTPTKSPSTTPSVSPTDSPSTTPTKSPSTTPTTTPTKSPTPSPTPETPCECQKGAVFPRTSIDLAPGQSDIYLYSAAFATYTIKDDEYVAVDISASDTMELRLCYNSDCVDDANPDSQIILTISATGAFTLSGYSKNGTIIPSVGPITPTGITSITQITSLYMVWDNDEFVNVGLQGDLVVGLGKQLGANEVIRINYNLVFDYEDDNKFIELVASSPNKNDGDSIEVCWFGSVQYECETLQTDCNIDPDYLVGQYEGYKLNCLTTSNGQICEWTDSSDKGNSIDSQYINGNTLTKVDLGSSGTGEVECVEIDPNFPCNARNTFSVKGNPSDSINIVSPSGLSFLPPLYTLFTVARYPSGATNKGVIFGNDSPRFESGFGPNGEEGYAYHEDAQITDTNNIADVYQFEDDPSINSFLLSADQRSMYRGNGIMYTVNTPTNDGPQYSPFKINPNGNTEWEILEILIFKVELTQEQVKCLEYKYFEPKYSITPLGPQCADIDFPITVKYPRDANATGSQFESFNIGDANECDNQCPDDTNVNCAGKQTLVNVRATQITTNMDMVWALQAGSEFVAGTILFDGAQEVGAGIPAGNGINPPSGASSLPTNSMLGSSPLDPLTLTLPQVFSSPALTQPAGSKILLTFKIIQIFSPASTQILVYNFDTKVVDVTYPVLFDATQVLYLRIGIDNDNMLQELQLDNLRTQTLCYTKSYTDFLASQSNPAKKVNNKKFLSSNEESINTLSNKKLYLILFGITILINIIMITCAITLWNRGSGKNLILFCKNKSSKKGYATFDDGASSCDESDTDNDEDILVPAKKLGRKNKKGYAAIVPVSESDME